MSELYVKMSRLVYERNLLSNDNCLACKITKCGSPNASSPWRAPFT